MVRDTLNPNFLAASCCIVDVVNGGAGFFVNGFFFTLLTVNTESLNEFKKSVKLSSSLVLFEYLALNFLFSLLINSPEVL